MVTLSLCVYYLHPLRESSGLGKWNSKAALRIQAPKAPVGSWTMGSLS